MRCSERNFDCSEEGSNVTSAKPLDGFIRLGNETRAFRCLEPKDRCTPETLKHKDVE